MTSKQVTSNGYEQPEPERAKLFPPAVVALAGWGLARIPTGFLPIEDQGYILVVVQLPDGAALARTRRALDQVSAVAGADPAVAHIVAISGISALDDSAPLANAGVAYVVLKGWSERADLRTIFGRLSQKLAAIDARVIALPPPPVRALPARAALTSRVGVAYCPC